jgi:hypothetical protein
VRGEARGERGGELLFERVLEDRPAEGDAECLWGKKKNERV